MSTGKDMEAAMAAGAAQYADVLHELNAAGLPTSFTQTGGMCAALEVQLENGRTLLITDFEDSLSWRRADHHGWSVGLYPSGSEYDNGPLAFQDSQDGSTPALFPLIKSVITVRQTNTQHDFGGL